MVFRSLAIRYLCARTGGGDRRPGDARALQRGSSRLRPSIRTHMYMCTSHTYRCTHLLVVHTKIYYTTSEVRGISSEM
eukprot:1932223-Pyramimonas_sp.AAC.1